MTSAKRFTLDGSDELEHHLEATCRRILSEVHTLVPPRKLVALVLGGGYGRGEGGVLRIDLGDCPYNDLEFYVFVSGNRFWNERVYGPALRALAQRLSPEAGLHVEFKIDSLSQMHSRPVSLFSYDLVSGHRSFLTGSVFRGCEHHLQAGAIPLFEASRLLFNRCTGLLLVSEILRRHSASASLPLSATAQETASPQSGTSSATFLSPEEADFIGRNLAKAQLCLGDAMLIAFGQYHWSCCERQRRLASLSTTESIPWFEEVRAHHREGVCFKLHPKQLCKSALEFEREHRQLSALCLKVWLWLENRRLGSGFTSIQDYAYESLTKYPGRGSWRNYLLNLRTFGFKAALAPLSWRYPRERLFRALSLLLWNAEGDSAKTETVRHLQKQLVTPAVDWPGFVSVYKQIWPQYG